MKRLLKAKKRFLIILDKILMKLFSSITPADIEYLINYIKPNKAIGLNSIPTKILKDFKIELSEQ